MVQTMKKPNIELLTGNAAVATAAKLARPQVIPAYPITPQTLIVETISSMIARGEFDCEFINVESEHSAMSACIGASAAGGLHKMGISTNGK